MRHLTPSSVLLLHAHWCNIRSAIKGCEMHSLRQIATTRLIMFCRWQQGLHRMQICILCGCSSSFPSHPHRNLKAHSADNLRSLWQAACKRYTAAFFAPRCPEVFLHANQADADAEGIDMTSPAMAHICMDLLDWQFVLPQTFCMQVCL